MPAHKHGCYNRAPLEGRTYPVQNGWRYVSRPGQGSTRDPVIQHVPHVMTTDCQYSQRTTDDPSCTGCIRKWTGP